MQDETLSNPSHLLSLEALNPAQIQHLLDLSHFLEFEAEGPAARPLHDKHVLFIFEKPSLRTVLGTEVAINQLGGHVIHTKPEIMLSQGKDVPFSSREAMIDTIMNVAQWCEAIFARVYSHATLTEMAALSPIPVVNALCEKHHPMQALADIFTIQQHFGADKPITLSFVGDANNVAQSLFHGLLKLGHEVRFTGPKAYGWSAAQAAEFQALAETYGGSFMQSETPAEVLPGSDIIYTDTFVSMGEEHLSEQKLSHFFGYQVNEAMLAQAGPESVFMHCQPAHRGVEVSDAVLDHERSLVKQQARNRMVSSKGVFASLLASQDEAHHLPETAHAV
jgi:ornithine carbamoyltransferase